MTLSTLNSNLDANHELVNDANPLDSNQMKLVNDANLSDSNLSTFHEIFSAQCFQLAR